MKKRRGVLKFRQTNETKERRAKGKGPEYAVGTASGLIRKRCHPGIASVFFSRIDSIGTAIPGCSRLLLFAAKFLC